MNVRKQNIFRALCMTILVSVLLFTNSLPVFANGLSDAQIEVLQKGIYYFNTEEDTCPGQTSNPSVTGKIYMIGDSVAAGANTQLNDAYKAKGFTEVEIKAVASRSLTNSNPTLNGLGVLTAEKANYSTASTVVVELGTNSSGLDAGNIQKAVDTIKSSSPSAKIFWVNVGADNSKRNGSPLNADGLNQIISSGSGYTIIDWSSQVKAHPEYIDPNPISGIGVHLSPAGKPAYANFIASSLSGNTTASASSGSCACTGSSILNGSDNASKIWNFLTGKGLSPIATAGVMGNLQKEAGFNPRRVQGTSTPGGDSDTMNINGKTGYGIAQWTSSGRQQKLHDFAVSRHTIDGDLGTQLDFLYQEAAGVWEKMGTFTDVSSATLYFHNTYEKSADGSTGLNQRVQFATDALAKFGGGGGGGSSGTASNSDASCASGGASTSLVVQTAMSLAWSDGSHGTTATSKYLTEAAKVDPSADSYKLTNCSFYVAVVMRTSGADAQYPTGCSRNQADYAKSHPEKYDVAESVSDISQLQPGDILVVGGCGKSGHTFIYIGNQAKTGYNKADASQGSRMPNLGTQKSLPTDRGPWTRIRLKG